MTGPVTGATTGGGAEPAAGVRAGADPAAGVRVGAEPARGVRVAIIGCGAIGSLYAAHLARVPGVEVWAVDPWAEHVAAMESRGLRVTGLADFVAKVHARTDARDLPDCDFGLVATKAG